MFGFLMGTTSDEVEGDLWQDREIRFDCAPKLLALRRGESIIDSINSVEDTKGNNGDRGCLTITNLRIMWQSHRHARANLSIGYNAVQSLTIKTTQTKAKTSAQALYAMTKVGSSRYEFIFTSLVKASPKLFTTAQAVLRAYETSRLYRDLKLRGAIVKDKALIQLPLERIFSRIEGVWNLSSDQGNLGVFIVTNVRLVWHAALAENFNVSVPFIQMRAMRLRDSKFGRALVIETAERAGGYLLGFRLDPPSALEACFKEITALHAAATTAPLFGIEFTPDTTTTAAAAGAGAASGAKGGAGTSSEGDATKSALRTTDDVEIVGDDGASDAFAAYFADSGRDGADKTVVFSAELGLAIEAPPDGLSLEKLWAVV